MIVAAAFTAGATSWLSLETLLVQRQTLQGWASTHGLAAMLGFVALYVAAAAVALPGAAVLGLLAGLLFGRWVGTSLMLLGATLAAALIFCVARSTLGGPLRRRAGPLYEKLASGMRRNGVEVLLALRLVPVFPFFLVTLLAAVLDVRLATVVLTTAIGLAPAALIYTSIGREIGSVTSLSGLLSPGALAALLGLAVLSLMPIAWRRWRTARPGGTAERP